MLDTSTLLASLAFALLAAGLSGAIAASLKQSVIVGYIVAGVFIGPYTPGFVADGGDVEGLAEIGVVLLLFVTGMEVSLRELSRAGVVAVAGAVIQVIVVIGLGYAAGQALGWGAVPSFVLGAVVSNSSSTVISKILGERGDGGSAYARLALAWSAIQDLTTIVLVVVITAMAAQGDNVVRDTATEVGKAAIFLLLLVPIGGRVLPWVFARIRAIGQREVFLLSTAAVALMAAYVASMFGLSPALGAFVAGVVLGESDIRHEVIDGLSPIRDVFVGLFFVSVGMLVDPGFLLSNAGTVLVVLALIVLAKGLVSAAVARAFRVPERVSIRTAGALAQSAEFSFLLASVGVGLGLLADDQFSTLIAAAALSVMISPAIVAAAARIAEAVDQALNRDLRDDPEARSRDALRDHVVVCGHGRVGQIVTAALATQGVTYAVIDQDPLKVSDLRERGIAALMGRADNELLLDRLKLADASVLVIAVPDRATVRRLVRIARDRSPDLTIVARTHEVAERDYLEANGVQEAVMGEQELALEIARYTLRRLRIDASEIEENLSATRHSGDPAAPPEGAT